MSYVTFGHHHYWIEGIGSWYLKVGEQILSGDGKNVQVADAGTGGLVFYAFLNSYFNDGFFLMKIISLLSVTGIVFISYYIIQNIFNSKIALVGQLFVAFAPQLDKFSILSLNDPLPTFLIFISLYFITKKQLKLSDLMVTGALLGISSMFRFQAIFVLLPILIYLLIRDNKIRVNLSYTIVLGVVFLIAISPMIIYNYSTHQTIFDTDPTFYTLQKSKYQTPEWREKLEPLRSEAPFAIFSDLDLFLKNYFFNLFYHNSDILFNFNTLGNISIIPPVTYLGIIPVLGGLIYSLKMKLNKTNLGVMFGTSAFTALLILWLGDIYIHFFAIIIIPFLVIGILNIKNVEKNFLPLLILAVVYFVAISIIPVYLGYHLFPVWLTATTLNAIFFTEVITKITSKIRSNKKINLNNSNVKIIIISVSVILLINAGFSYKLLNAYLYNDSSVGGVKEEFSKLFQKREPIDENGYEIKLIEEILSKQPGIENSYVMSNYPTEAYYAGSKWLYTEYREGSKNATLDKFITRESWSDYEIYFSNIVGFPIDRYDIFKPIPDYLVYHDTEGPTSDDVFTELADPNNPKIPSNWQVIYKSNETGTIVYKINHKK